MSSEKPAFLVEKEKRDAAKKAAGAANTAIKALEAAHRAARERCEVASEAIVGLGQPAPDYAARIARAPLLWREAAGGGVAANGKEEPAHAAGVTVASLAGCAPWQKLRTSAPQEMNQV